MKNIGSLCVGFALMISLNSSGQKTISEGTITYNILIQSKKTENNVSNGLNGSTTSIYLKGNLSRIDMASSLGNETTIYNAKNGTAVILKEYSGQKLMISLTKENWDTRNKKFDGLTFENTPEQKVIEGYKCRHAVAKLKDGSIISVFYTPDLVPANSDYNEAFKTLPGLPIEYDFETEKLTFKYHLSNIDFNTISLSKFEFPKSGYRVMTYDENKRNKAYD